MKMMKIDNLEDLLTRLSALQAKRQTPLPTWDEWEEMQALVDEAWNRLQHVKNLVSAAERLAADIE